MYFKPYRYVKEHPSARSGLWSALGKSRKTSLFWNQIFPSGLIFSGSLIISSQLILPFLSFPTQDYFLVRPVKTFRVLGASYEEQAANLPGDEGEDESLRDDVPPLFFLSIPKLGIEKARVKKDTVEEDPRDFLGHLLGSSLPGEKGGSIFIYGHSTFPWLFDPDNYLTIFSTLPKLERGDRIFLEYPGKRWEYRVEGFKTLNPEEVNPFSFKSGAGVPSRLVIMTCVPPGTRLRRFLVFASLLGVEETT